MSDSRNISVRNTDENKWDKPIVEAKNLNEYYRLIRDKRIFEKAEVILVEEEEQYTLIKNKWKYHHDKKLCRDFQGEKFNVEDIEYIRIKEEEYLILENIDDVLPKNIIIKLK